MDQQERTASELIIGIFSLMSYKAQSKLLDRMIKVFAKKR